MKTATKSEGILKCLLVLFGLTFLVFSCQTEEFITPTGEIQSAAKTVNKGTKFEILDINFELALIEEGIEVVDHFVLKSDAKEIKHLRLYGKNIDDLSGIEFFENLEGLECFDNNLTSLDISKNKKLKVLLCGGNQLENLDVSKNLELEMLFCENNLLTELKLEKNLNLYWLNCTHNQLTFLDVSNHKNLEVIECQFNEIESIELADSPELVWLSCNDNQIKRLTVAQSPILEILDCSNNQLEFVQVNQFQFDSKISNWIKDEETIFCVKCKFTFVPDNTFEQALIDLGFDGVLDNYVLTENINKITRLDVRGKGINDLTGIEDFLGLKTLICGGNPLGSIDVSKNSELEYLYCYSNQLTSIDVSKNYNLLLLSCMGNQLTQLDVSKNKALKYLFFYSNNITSLNVSNNLELERLYCYNNQMTSIDVSPNDKLRDFHCYNNQIACIQVNEGQIASIPSNWVKDSTATYSLNCN